MIKLCCECLSVGVFDCRCICSYHVTYVFKSEFTLYSCFNVKELLARNIALYLKYLKLDIENTFCGSFSDFIPSSMHKIPIFQEIKKYKLYAH